MAVENHCRSARHDLPLLEVFKRGDPGLEAAGMRRMSDQSDWGGGMKLYDFTRAPNPRRVRIFLAEKGITMPMEQIDLFTGANRTPEALGRNPYGGLPVLELDDGTCIAESVAICRYFEGLHPSRR
jgi:hypothetical protein